MRSSAFFTTGSKAQTHAQTYTWPSTHKHTHIHKQTHNTHPHTHTHTNTDTHTHTHAHTQPNTHSQISTNTNTPPTTYFLLCAHEWEPHGCLSQMSVSEHHTKQNSDKGLECREIQLSATTQKTSVATLVWKTRMEEKKNLKTAMRVTPMSEPAHADPTKSSLRPRP